MTFDFIVSGWIESHISIYHNVFEKYGRELLNSSKVGMTKYMNCSKIYFLHKDQMRPEWYERLNFKIEKIQKNSQPNLYFIIMYKPEKAKGLIKTLDPDIVISFFQGKNTANDLLIENHSSVKFNDPLLNSPVSMDTRYDYSDNTGGNMWNSEHIQKNDEKLLQKRSRRGSVDLEDHEGNIMGKKLKTDNSFLTNKYINASFNEISQNASKTIVEDNKKLVTSFMSEFKQLFGQKTKINTPQNNFSKKNISSNGQKYKNYNNVPANENMLTKMKQLQLDTKSIEKITSKLDGNAKQTFENVLLNILDKQRCQPASKLTQQKPISASRNLEPNYISKLLSFQCQSVGSNQNNSNVISNKKSNRDDLRQQSNFAGKLSHNPSNISNHFSRPQKKQNSNASFSNMRSDLSINPIDQLLRGNINRSSNIVNENNTVQSNNVDVFKMITNISKNIIDSQIKPKDEPQISQTPSDKLFNNQYNITPTFARAISLTSDKHVQSFSNFGASNHSVNKFHYKLKDDELNTKENNVHQNKQNFLFDQRPQPFFSKPLVHSRAFVRNSHNTKNNVNSSSGNIDIRINNKKTKIVELTNFNSLLEHDIQNTEGQKNKISAVDYEANNFHNILPISKSYSRSKQKEFMNNNNTLAQDLQTVKLIIQNNSTNYQQSLMGVSKLMFSNRSINSNKNSNVPYLLN